MNILSDIEKARKIPCADENLLFILQKEPKISKQNQRMNKFKPPQNVNLYGNDNSGTEMCEVVTHNNCVPESEIESSIKEVNSGINYSNEYLEKHWKARQIENNLNFNITCMENDILSVTTEDPKNSSTEVCNKTILSQSQNNGEMNDEVKENILKKCKLNKNAAIRGLLKSHKISLKDLRIPSDGIDINDRGDINVQKENAPTTTLNEEMCNMKLVQYPEDPEVLLHPLQVYGSIDESKYKNIDFTVPRVGKKKAVTPRQFFLKMGDTSFDFVKKDVRKKK